MAAAALNKSSRLGIWPILLLFGILLVSLSLMSDATHHSERFGQLYSWLLLVNALGLIVLVAMIGTNLYWMVSQYRARAPGALLTARLAIAFVVLAVVPIGIVYYFSLQFLQRGIDSWFNVEIEEALEDSLELSRGALDVRLGDLLQLTDKLSDELEDMSSSHIPIGLYDLRVRSGAIELTVFGSDGRIVASSSQDSSDLIPTRPSKEVLMVLSQGRPYVALDPLGSTGLLYVRAVVPMLSDKLGSEPLTLQALFQVPGRLSELADNVQSQIARYKELTFLRKPLKFSYMLTLSLVLVLSLLSAVWAAFYSARRLVAPIGELADGTRAVAEGDYSKRLPVTSEDELGFLVRSFNDMTRRLARARDQTRQSQAEVESQRTYLETVLGSLSSGVVTIGSDDTVKTVNNAASEILGVDAARYLGCNINELAESYAFLAPLVAVLKERDKDDAEQWQEQIVLTGNDGRRVLMCRSAVLPVSEALTGGQVVVFDDVTDIIRAQRESAWGEVARRLAHEIKNPLTPIQLSAERLRRKYLNMMPESDAVVLDSATHTIVQQVESLKEMVNAFSDYARAPNLELKPLLLHDLLQEVLDLYKSNENTIKTRLAQPEPLISADAGRLRQLMHNLIKNALESVHGIENSMLLVETRWVTENGDQYIKLCFEDNGGGFTQEALEHMFEPYVTTKARGTGLGLAIVKKIVEEHNGQIFAFNTEAEHARIEIRFSGQRAA